MNSAQRLHDLFAEARAYNGSEASYLVWLKLLGLEDEPPEEYEDIAMAGISAIRAELETLRATLKDLGCPQELFNESISQLKSIPSVVNFNAAWHQVGRDRIAAEYLMTLKWASWHLGTQERPMLEEERLKLLNDIDELIVEIQNCTMPTFTKDLVLRQLDAARRALFSYRVQGIEPLTAALNETVGTMRTQGAHVSADLTRSDPPAQGLVARAAEMFNKLAEYVDKAEKVQSGVEKAIGIVHQVQKIWDQLPSFPQLPGS